MTDVTLQEVEHSTNQTLTLLELEKVREITQKLTEIRNGLGDIEVKFINLNVTKSDLTNKYSEARNAEAKLINELTEKYGKISINIETGEITQITQ